MFNILIYIGGVVEATTLQIHLNYFLPASDKTSKVFYKFENVKFSFRKN